MTDLLERPPTRRAGPDRPRIDPRIAQRWVDARRQEGRRRLRVVVAVACVGAVAALAGGSLYTPLFAVNHVRVALTGQPAIPAGRIEAEAGLAHHPLMINLDPAVAARRLDADPVLGGARVAKHWPGTVDVTVTERSPLAQVALPGNPAAFVAVDPTGRVLGRPGPQVIGRPILQVTGPLPAAGGWINGSAGPAAAPAGPAGAEVDMAAVSDGPDVPAGAAAALAFLQALPATLRAAVQSAAAGPGPGVTVVIAPPRLATGTVTVSLGDGSQLAAKVTALVTLMGQADLGGVTAIDLSVPDRPAAATGTAGGGAH